MPSCSRILEVLEELLDDPEALRFHRDLEAHLRTCMTCRVTYDTTRQTLRIVTESRTFDLSPDLSERVVSQIMTAVRAKVGSSEPPPTP